MLEQKILDKFARLSADMSPENLFADGERSRAEGLRLLKGYKKEWKALEVQVGRMVDEGEVWAQLSREFGQFIGM